MLGAVSLGAFGASISSATAQNETADADRDSIIVTGTRIPSPLDQIGRSVSVISVEDLEIRQNQFVYDALNAVPGLQIVRSGSFGALTSVSLRGLPSDQTLVVQDGIVLNNPSSFGNGFNFARFDTTDVERIEVLRGAQSTLYGSDAIGGVINIITKDGRKGFAGDAFIEGGSFGTYHGSASVMGGNEIASGRLTIGGVSTRGFSSADEANGNTEDDSFRNITLSSRGRLSPTPSLSLEGVVRFQDSRNEFDGFDFLTGAADADEVSETNELAIAGIVTHTMLDDRVENKLTISYFRNDRLNLSDGIPSFDAIGTRVSYEYQATLTPAEWITVVAGAEYDEQESEVAVGFGGNQTIETTSGFGLVRLQPLSFLTINGGVRHDSSPEFSDETTFTVSAVAVAPQTETLFRGSFAEGFRAPTAGEFSFNPNLFAEFSRGWDIGVEQPLLGGRAILSATFFDQEIVDLIAFDLAAFTFVNIQEFTSKGVEVALDTKLSDTISVNTAYTYTDALNLSTNIAAGNQPDHRVSIEVAAKPTEKLTLSVGISYNGEEEDGAQILDDYVLVNLRGAYAISDNLSLYARLENLTDTEYQDNFGFGTAPISVFGGIRAGF